MGRNGSGDSAERELPGLERRRQRGRAHEPAVDRPRAHERPSAIAQTIRLWPRVWSPQTNTPSTLVAQFRVRRHRAPWPDLDAELVHHVVALRAQKPMANSTSSHSSSNSSPAPPRRQGARSRPISTVCPRRARTAPAPSSTNSVVVTEKSRAPPSSWADDVRRISGHSGHGLSASRSLGGSAMISSWCTERRALAVGRAEAVGPGVAAADDDDALAPGVDGRPPSAPSCTRLEGFRYSRAKWTPSRSRPGHRQVTRQGGARRPERPRRTRPAPRPPGAPSTSGAQAVPMPRSSPGSTTLDSTLSRVGDRRGAHRPTSSTRR